MSNLIVITGNVGKEPERRTLPGGGAVLIFSVADNYKSKGQPMTQWHQIVCFEKLAELASQYVHSGRLVYVEGELRIRENKGPNQRYGTPVIEVVASKVRVLGSSGNSIGYHKADDHAKRAAGDFDPDEDVPQ